MSETVPSAVAQSLQEIATLLLMFHENYFDNEEVTVLESLCSFIDDVGLTPIVSVLDIERCRRAVMRDSSFSDPMSYEIFYSWLREIADHVYKMQFKVRFIDNDGGRRKALHLLLTKYIIPFATSEMITNSNEDNKYVFYGSLKNDLLDCFLEYNNFIHLWWLHLLLLSQSDSNKEVAVNRFSPVETLRCKHMGLSRSTVLVDFVLHFFKNIDFITEIEIKNCLDFIVREKSACEVSAGEVSAGQQCINFLDFLYLIENLSVRTASNNIPLVTKVTTFVQRIGDCLFRTVLGSLYALESDNSIAEGFSYRNSISSQSLFLFMRQCGVTQLDHVSIKFLYDLAFDYSDEGGDILSRSWSEKGMYCLLLDLLSKQKDNYSGLNLADLKAKATTRMLMGLPSVFFVSPKAVPPIVCDIWKADFINYVKENEKVIYSVYESCHALFYGSNDDNNGYISIENIIRSFEIFGVIPKFLRPVTVAKACELVVGMGELDQNNLIGKNDFIEIMYICAQICFSDNSDASKSKHLNSLERYIMLTNAINISKKNVDTSSDSERNPGSIQDSFLKNSKDIYVLLVHYPKNSFKLSPWDVSRLLHRCKDQSISEHLSVDHSSIEFVLPTIFREFCDYYSVSTIELGAFLSSFFSDKNSQLKHAILQTLSDSFYLNVLLDERILRLLHSNEELLRWEFVRLVASSQNARNVRQMFLYISPMPTKIEMSDAKSADEATISCQTVIPWAVEAFGVSNEEVSAILKQTVVLMGSGHNGNQNFETSFLTFSTFVVFALYCSSHGLDKDDVVVDTYLAKIKSMLKKFSANLTMVQTSLKIKFSYVLSDSFLSSLSYINEHSKSHDIESSLIQLVQTSMKVASEGLVSSPKIPFIPPSPPIILYDGPRFLEFCKFSGILLFINDFNLSFVSLWYSYGAYLNSINGNLGFSIGSISPLPMKADAASVYQLLKLVFVGVHAIDGKEDVDNPSIMAKIMSTLLPIAASFIDRSKNIPPHIANNKRLGSNYISLEHILRYGGQMMVQAMYSNREWLRQVFSMLKNKVDADKKLRESDTVSFPTLCNYMSCNGLLLTTIVIANIRYSLQPKIRRIIYDSEAINDYQELRNINLCYVEFEEVLLRCAFSLWELSATGLNNSSDPSIILASIADLTLSSSKYLRSIVTAYSNAATEACKISNTDSNWGVDFASPYIVSLKQLDMMIRKASNAPTDMISSRIGENSLIPSPSIIRDELPDLKQCPAAVTTVDTSSALIELTKEELWPVFATFCSCGDSTDPGMLSGPNLFTLLAKLDLLEKNTRLSDIGLLIHQVSNHHHTSQNVLISPKGIGNGFGECDAPSLSFEEFLVYLCIYADLLKDTTIDIRLLMEQIVTSIPKREKTESPRFSRESSYSEIFGSNREDLTVIKLSDYWFQMWQKYMKSSSNFNALLQGIILPKLKKYPLLESPEDARQRDMYSCIFSLEVLLAIEEIEGKLSEAFDRLRCSTCDEAYKFEREIKHVLVALESLSLVPQLLTAESVTKIAQNNFELRSSSKLSKDTESVLYSQLEWVICIVGFHVMEAISMHADTTKYDFIFASDNKGNRNHMVADAIKHVASTL